MGKQWEQSLAATHLVLMLEGELTALRPCDRETLLFSVYYQRLQMVSCVFSLLLLDSALTSLPPVFIHICLPLCL